MKCYTINHDAPLYQEIHELFNVKARWDAATVEIGKMIGIPDLEEVGISTSKLYISPQELDKLEEGEKRFRYEKGFYTPRLNRKEGKAWAQKFKEIAERHKLDVQPFGVLMFMRGMHNTSYAKPYREMSVFEEGGDLYIAWEGHGLPKTSEFTEITTVAYYEAKIRKEKADAEKGD